MLEQTPPDPAAVPANCFKTCPNGHPAIPIPGTHYALTTDEVYGTFTDPGRGRAWGWARILNVADPAHRAVHQLLLPQPHRPAHLAFIDWHSGGLQAIDLSDPANLARVGFFLPNPLNKVALEDPALSEGPNKVALWSYSIIRNGLIYTIDIRNGPYVLEYTGPTQSEVAGISFLEGNSNLGEAIQLAPRKPTSKYRGCSPSSAR